jgi:hypothetical protein
MDPRPGMPPMSTTSLPSSSERAPSSPPAAAKPPILASDILREEIAPLAPARSAIRGLLLPLVLGFAAWAAASAFGWTSGTGAPPGPPFEAGVALVTAAAALAALFGGPYAARASLATVAGMTPLVLGARGQGPLASIAAGGLAGGASLVVITILPAALFFRSQYRAFVAARWLLAATLVLALPTVYFLALEALAAGPPLLRGLDAMAAAAVLTSLGGFLGPETTGACTTWGVLILTTYAARVFGASWLGQSSVDLPLAVAIGLGEGVAGAVASVGIYQLLASLFARRARKADIHKILGPSAEEEP